MELNMGLDMYLYADKSVSSESDGNPVMEDGFIVNSKILDAGYWRKHANLHGFIVQQFANGEDECQKIWLNEDDLQLIINALQSDSIYEERVEGFFFGKSYFPGESDGFSSYDEQKARDINIFTKALEWLRNAAPAVGEYGDPDFKWAENRSIYYRASW
jgi:hypothetical protein